VHYDGNKGGEMTDKEAKELAEAHWEFIEKWLHMVYVDAMIHGIKHGQQRQEDKDDRES